MSIGRVYEPINTVKNMYNLYHYKATQKETRDKISKSAMVQGLLPVFYEERHKSTVVTMGISM